MCVKSGPNATERSLQTAPEYKWIELALVVYYYKTYNWKYIHGYTLYLHFPPTYLLYQYLEIIFVIKGLLTSRLPTSRDRLKQKYMSCSGEWIKSSKFKPLEQKVRFAVTKKTRINRVELSNPASPDLVSLVLHHLQK